MTPTYAMNTTVTLKLNVNTYSIFHTFLCVHFLGENVLHMAIVHEDPAMVRFLLNHEVNLHQRCCGNFFTADDQKSSRSDSPDHEWVDLCLKTNYGGYVQ